MITFQCPSCFHEMRAREALLGKKVRCKLCKELVSVEIYEPPEDLEEEARLGKPPPTRTLRKKKKRGESPGSVALRLAIDYSGFIILGVFLIAAFIGICTSRTIATIGFGLFAVGGVVACTGAYAWALIQASAEEPMSLLGFLLPRYGLRMIIRNRASIQGPLPVFCAGLGALALAAISLRIGVAQPAAEERWTPPPPRQPVQAAQVAAPPASQKPAPQSPHQQLLGGLTPVPTEAIESLAVLKRGMKVWVLVAKWEQGTVIGRHPAGWLVVQKSDGFLQGEELSLPLERFRIEASELSRDDLRDVAPISEEPEVVPAQVRQFEEEFQRAKEKTRQGRKRP
jgi:hypothetical protein